MKEMLHLQKLQTIGEDFCGLDVNTPLGGQEPMTAVPVLTFDKTLLTAVAATSTSDYTVVFLGTSEGHLKKVSSRLPSRLPYLASLDLYYLFAPKQFSNSCLELVSERERERERERESE
jgi:hypothetical protein